MPNPSRRSSIETTASERTIRTSHGKSAAIRSAAAATRRAQEEDEPAAGGGNTSQKPRSQAQQVAAQPPQSRKPGRRHSLSDEQSAFNQEAVVAATTSTQHQPSQRSQQQGPRRRKSIGSNDLWGLAVARLNPPSATTATQSSAAAAAVDQQQPSSGEESSEIGQTIVVHSIPVPVPTFHRDLGAPGEPKSDVSERSSSPSFFPPKPDQIGLRRRRSTSAPKRRSSPPQDAAGTRVSTTNGQVATKSGSSNSDSERSSGNNVRRRSSMKSRSSSTSSPSPPSRPARGDRPRRRATCDSIASVTSRNSLRFDIVDSDADEEDDDVWDTADNPDGDNSLTNMEVMDLRPSSRSDDVQRMLETSSLVSFSSNISIDSELASGLFQVASNTERDRVHLKTEQGISEVGEALKGDLPRHWEAVGAGYAAGGNGLDVSTTGGDEEMGQQRRPSIMSTLTMDNPLGESEQAYRALMSLMKSDPYENNDESGEDNGKAATREQLVAIGEGGEGGTASRKSSGGSGLGGLVSVGFGGSGDGSGRVQKRRGSNYSDNSAESRRSGFWSAIGTLTGNHSDDESYSHDGSDSSSAYTESSPLTHARRKRRRLYVRHCARAMVVFVALAALSGSLVYFVPEEDNPFVLVSSLFGGDGGEEDEEVSMEEPGERKLPLTGDIDMEPRDRAHLPFLRRVELPNTVSGGPGSFGLTFSPAEPEERKSWDETRALHPNTASGSRTMINTGNLAQTLSPDEPEVRELRTLSEELKVRGIRANTHRAHMVQERLRQQRQAPGGGEAQRRRAMTEDQDPSFYAQDGPYEYAHNQDHRQLMGQGQQEPPVFAPHVNEFGQQGYPGGFAQQDPDFIHQQQGLQYNNAEFAQQQQQQYHQGGWMANHEQQHL